MSQAGLQEILDQLSSDSAFRERIDVDPEGGIGGHDLSADEADALLSWDSARIEAALGGPLTPAIHSLLAEMNPSMTRSSGDSPAPVYEPPPQTAGGRLGVEGYKKREH